MAEKYIPRLYKRYKEEVVPKLMKEFGYKNVMEVPKIAKITLNMGLGEGARNFKIIEEGLEELAVIAGQRPCITRARKAIAGFKIRKGMPVGVKVTLRRQRMWDFFDKLITIALPRVRDFRGVSRSSFDGRGNYNLGIEDHLVFPEVDYNKVNYNKGLNISITTTARTDEEAMALLEALGMPFAR